MEPNARIAQSPSLEERIHTAHAERSMAMGYAIGEALEALWRVLSAFPFSPSASSTRKPAFWRALRARIALHR
jgi:hypothetical protein